MLAASRERRVLDLGDAVVDAADIRAAVLAAGDADPYGLRLSRARVAGPLDLRACEVGVPLQFQSCAFTGPVNVEGAALHELVVTDGLLPGLYARGVRIAHDLTLSGTTVT